MASPIEQAGIGHVGDGHCGAEAPCPHCGATDRTAETDFNGGARLRCVSCRHVEPVVRRPPPVEAPTMIVPNVLAWMNAQAAEDAHNRRYHTGARKTTTQKDDEYLPRIPTTWVTRTALTQMLGLDRGGFEAMERRLMCRHLVERKTDIAPNEAGLRRRVAMLRRVAR